MTVRSVEMRMRVSGMPRHIMDCLGKRGTRPVPGLRSPANEIRIRSAVALSHVASLLAVSAEFKVQHLTLRCSGGLDSSTEDGLREAIEHSRWRGDHARCWSMRPASPLVRGWVSQF
jgi:hypothetical protein